MDDLKETINRPFIWNGKTYNGVVGRSDHGVLDEIEYAYKPVVKIMELQQDLVEVVNQLKQLVVIKG